MKTNISTDNYTNGKPLRIRHLILQLSVFVCVWGQVETQSRIHNLRNPVRDKSAKSHFSFHTFWLDARCLLFPSKHPWDRLKPPQSASWEKLPLCWCCLATEQQTYARYREDFWPVLIEYNMASTAGWVEFFFFFKCEEIRHGTLITSVVMTEQELTLIPHCLTFLFLFSNKCIEILPLPDMQSAPPFCCSIGWQWRHCSALSQSETSVTTSGP